MRSLTIMACLTPLLASCFFSSDPNGDRAALNALGLDKALPGDTLVWANLPVVTQGGEGEGARLGLFADSNQMAPVGRQEFGDGHALDQKLSLRFDMTDTSSANWSNDSVYLRMRLDSLILKDSIGAGIENVTLRVEWRRLVSYAFGKSLTTAQTDTLNRIKYSDSAWKAQTDTATWSDFEVQVPTNSSDVRITLPKAAVEALRAGRMDNQFLDLRLSTGSGFLVFRNNAVADTANKFKMFRSNLGVTPLQFVRESRYVGPASSVLLGSIGDTLTLNWDLQSVRDSLAARGYWKTESEVEGGVYPLIRTAYSQLSGLQELRTVRGEAVRVRFLGVFDSTVYEPGNTLFMNQWDSAWTLKSGVQSMAPTFQMTDVVARALMQSSRSAKVTVKMLLSPNYNAASSVVGGYNRSLLILDPAGLKTSLRLVVSPLKGHGQGGQY